MGIKLLWFGLTLMIAVTVVLNMVGLSPNNIFNQVGAVVMVVGAVLFALDK